MDVEIEYGESYDDQMMRYGQEYTLKSAIKREQSQTCLSYAEREQTRTKFKS